MNEYSNTGTKVKWIKSQRELAEAKRIVGDYSMEVCKLFHHRLASFRDLVSLSLLLISLSLSFMENIRPTLMIHY